MRLNQPIVGFLIGLVMPLLGFVVVYFVLGSGHNSLSTFFQYVMGAPKVMAKVLSLSILANIIPFLYFTRRRLDYAARGIFIATVLYAVAIVLLKFLG